MSERTINVKKDQLIEKIKANKEIHIQEYKLALELYIKESKKQLSEKLKEIKKFDPENFEKQINSTIQLISPVNRSEDYDKLIIQFQWEVEDVVELTQQEFNQYVHDEFSWSQNAKISNTYYAGGL